MSQKNGVKLEYEVFKNDFTRAGEASSNVKKILTQLGIKSQTIRRIAIATYEAEMNIAIHSLGGKIIVNVSSEEIEVIAKDNGPGIEDIELAMEEGYSTAPNSVRELGFGAGMGLANMKKCSDEFKITSAKDSETQVYMKTYVN